MGYLDKLKARKLQRQQHNKISEELTLKRKESRELYIELGEIFRAMISDSRYIKAKGVYAKLYESVKDELVSVPIGPESETKRALLVALQEIIGLPVEYNDVLKEIEKEAEGGKDAD